MIEENESTIEVVPESWIISHPSLGSPCKQLYYPKKAKNITGLIKKAVQPQKTWELFNVKVLKGGIRGESV